MMVNVQCEILSVNKISLKLKWLAKQIIKVSYKASC